MLCCCGPAGQRLQEEQAEAQQDPYGLLEMSLSYVAQEENTHTGVFQSYHPTELTNPKADLYIQIFSLVY